MRGRGQVLLHDLPGATHFLATHQPELVLGLVLPALEAAFRCR